MHVSHITTTIQHQMFAPHTLDAYAAAGLTSSVGTAYVFDKRANGFVRGEGCGAGVLSMGMQSARVSGSAVRQDGRSASLTAPNGRAQRLMLHAVLNDACANPTQLQQSEAAANGSAMGDAIETGAVAAALLAVRGEDLLVGSVKGNVGHTESASGMLGLVKLLSTMLRAKAAPNAQLLMMAEPVAMALRDTLRHCALPTQLAAATRNGGSASSFGLGGTIAGVTLQAAVWSVTRCQVYAQSAGPGDDASPNYILAYARRNFPWVTPLRVHLARRGAISGLELCEQPAFESLLATGEVELQVRAVGLNFRDVLIVLGEYPGVPLDPGSDCAGTVTSAGNQTPRVRRGHELFGAAPGCLSTFVRARTNALLLVHRPAHTTAEGACTLPATWSTVHEVIRRGCLRGCEQLLLHAATGGVGLILVVYLHWCWAHIIATAGRASKHEILRNLSVASSCSSRQGVTFAYGVSSKLGSIRVQGACNSLSNDFTSSSLAGTVYYNGPPN